MNDKGIKIASGGPPDEEALAQMQADAEKRQAKTDEILAANPRLPALTAIIMAGDAIGAEHWRERAEKGEMSWEDSVTLTGSYAKMESAVRALAGGHVTDEWVLKNLPDLWQSADPDDTDPRMLALWQNMKALNGDQIVTDDPKGVPQWGEDLTIYRGQRPGDPPGIAWTPDIKVALKFARGASLRVAIKDGQIACGEIQVKDILGWVTGRGESEIICDPQDVAVYALADVKDAQARFWVGKR